MQANRIASPIAAVTVIVAGALVLLTRAPSDEAPLLAPMDEPLTIAVGDTPRPRAGEPAPQNDGPAVAKVRELEAMSETYRNTTFVIAIRDAGYTCNELLHVYGLEDSGKWAVSCSQLLAYTIGITGSGALRVEPMTPYFDGLRPEATRDGQNVVPAQPPVRTFPETLPPPR